ncbi:hypothetical protein AB1N83_014034 [Pleurotus pulmonarius]
MSCCANPNRAVFNLGDLSSSSKCPRKLQYFHEFSSADSSSKTQLAFRLQSALAVAGDSVVWKRQTMGSGGGVVHREQGSRPSIKTEWQSSGFVWDPVQRPDLELEASSFARAGIFESNIQGPSLTVLEVTGFQRNSLEVNILGWW